VSTHPTPHETLHKYFGFSEFREGQLEIVESILSLHDTLAILPTGGGKSLCFQIPGLMLEGTTLVISPLISLMKDQVDRLNSKGIAATYINSSLEKQDLDQRLTLAKSGTYRFLYISPERLASQAFIEVISAITIPLVIIDEAHCISEWGHDFRPEFREIADRLTLLPQRPVIAAFTATATIQVKNDIVTSLRLEQPRIFSQPTVRTNLSLHAYFCHGATCQELALFRLLKKHRAQSGIIYAATRQHTVMLADRINAWLEQEASAPVGRARARKKQTMQAAAYYHGGVDALERSSIQQAFIENKVRVVVATNAFGMGIDKPDIRFVIHYQMPGSIEQYSQEAGRAGRDRKPAAAYVLYNPENLTIHTKLIEHTKDNARLREQRLLKLAKLSEFCTEQRCKHAVMSEYFGESSDDCRDRCSFCSGEEFDHPLLVAVSDPSEKEFIHRLQEKRAELADQHRLLLTEVCTDKVLCQLALHRPQTQAGCSLISGVGDGWLERWWESFKPLLRQHSEVTVLAK
jgi:ATP-dependent DNA helicase RecQ